MEYQREMYLKGLRFEFINFRKSLLSNHLNDVECLHEQLKGYIAGGMWAEIISITEYHGIYETACKLYDSYFFIKL